MKTISTKKKILTKKTLVENLFEFINGKYASISIAFLLICCLKTYSKNALDFVEYCKILLQLFKGT